MPCFTVTTTEVDTGKMNGVLLVAALNALDLRPSHHKYMTIDFTNGSFDCKSGTLTLQGSQIEQRTSQIKRAYSAEVIKSQAKRFNWQLKETAPFQYQITKR